MRTAVLCLALFSSVSLAQTAPPAARPKKVFTPEQIAFQAALKTYNAQADQLRAAAASAFNAEAAREKAPECADARTTYDINMCLAHENDLTDANLKTFAANIRAMLALDPPRVPGLPDPIVGPSGPEGTPATNTAAFDKAQAAWAAYAEAECSAMDTLWRGGTIVNAVVGECGLRLSRLHLHELDTAYSLNLHPR